MHRKRLAPLTAPPQAFAAGAVLRRAAHTAHNRSLDSREAFQRQHRLVWRGCAQEMVESNQKLMSNETLECMQRSYLAMWVKMGAEDEDTKENEQAAPAATVKTAWSRLGYKDIRLFKDILLLILWGFVMANDPSIVIVPNKLGLPDWLHAGACHACYCAFACLWVRL